MPTHSPVDDVIESIAATERHLIHEYAADWDATLETVHPNARYALAQPGFSKVINGHAGIDTHYRSMESVTIPHASRLVAHIATDWYMFFENFPTRIDVASGEWRIVHTATLAPIAAPHIIGEMLWEREPQTQPDAPDAGVASLRVHEQLLEAMREGDAAALTSLIDPEALWAERDYVSEAKEQPVLDLHGAAAAVDHLRRWQAAWRPERVSVLNRIATAWYVFAEELWIVVGPGGERRQLRKANIYPLTPAGKVRGAIGWGTDMTPASGPGATASYGKGFWERPPGDFTPDPLLRSRTR
jgi:hypothetical protein